MTILTRKFTQIFLLKITFVKFDAYSRQIDSLIFPSKKRSEKKSLIITEPNLLLYLYYVFFFNFI